MNGGNGRDVWGETGGNRRVVYDVDYTPPINEEQCFHLRLRQQFIVMLDEEEDWCWGRNGERAKYVGEGETRDNGGASCTKSECADLRPRQR